MPATRRIQRWVFVALLIACLILAARVGERYPLRVDLSAQQINSLSATAEQALGALQETLEITAFVPEFAVQRVQIDQLLAPYLAHPAGARFRYSDPVKDPEQARAAGVANHGEIHLQVGAGREVIRTPSSAAMDAALQRLARRGERWIVSLRGHGERPLDENPGGLGRFAASVEALGYRIITLDPRQLEQLPNNTAVLLIAAPDATYPPHVNDLIARFATEGGSLLWLLGETGATIPGLDLGVEVLPGHIVDAAAARYGLDRPDNAIVTYFPDLLTMPADSLSVLPQARGLRVSPSADWRVVGRLQSSPRSWNETGPLTGQVSRDPARGESPGPLTVGVALQRDEAAQAQGRIWVIGGSQWLANDRIGQAANLQLASALINWLSGNEQLAGTRPAPGLEIRWSPMLGSLLAVGLMAGLPLLYLVIGLGLRARRRRA